MKILPFCQKCTFKSDLPTPPPDQGLYEDISVTASIICPCPIIGRSLLIGIYKGLSTYLDNFSGVTIILLLYEKNQQHGCFYQDTLVYVLLISYSAAP